MDRYSTAFTSYEEFECVFRIIPERYRLSWVRELTIDQMKIARFWDGYTVAHELGFLGYLPDEFSKNVNIIDIFPAVDYYGDTVVHSMAQGGCLSRELLTEDILSLTSKSKTTVLGDFLGWVMSEEESIDISQEILHTEVLSGKTILDLIIEDLDKQFSGDVNRIINCMTLEVIESIYFRTKNPELKKTIDNTGIRILYAERAALDRISSNECDGEEPDIYFLERGE